MAFYTLIEDLQLVATAAGLPRTEKMMVNYGLEIVQRREILRRAYWSGLGKMRQIRHGLPSKGTLAKPIET